MKDSSEQGNRESGTGYSIHVGLRRVALAISSICIAAEILCVYLDYRVSYSYGTEIGPIRRLLNITREDGLASWFGTTQTAFVAATLWLIVALAARRTWTRTGWIVLAVFFSYMAFDDGTEFHERMGSTFQDLQERAITSGQTISLVQKLNDAFPSYPWQVLFMPAFVVLGAFTAAFLFKQLGSTGQRVILLLSLGLLALAVGLDFVEGLEPEHRWNFYTRLAEANEWDAYTVAHFREKPYDAIRHFSKSAEEFMEMLAMTGIWSVLLLHVGRVSGGKFTIHCN